MVGSGGRAVASDTSDPQFESRHRQYLFYQLYNQNTEKTKIKKKRPGSLYGPERIARAYLKADKDRGGISGVDVESFLQALAVRQYSKAMKHHRGLGKLQASYYNLACGISLVARQTLRQNCKRFAQLYAMPDVHQIQSISSIPLNLLLTVGSVANHRASQLGIDSLSSLQAAYLNGGGRIGAASILRAIPTAFARLVRLGSLVPMPANIMWFSHEQICGLDSLPTKKIRMNIMEDRLPGLGPNIGRIYKRNDWPPPGEMTSTFKGIWAIKHPTLRGIRLKTLYEDIFSNERRHRFGLTASPTCLSCGQIESVEHHIFSCNNANRIWNLYLRLTGVMVTSLFDVVRCDHGIEAEIIKSVLIKALLQIDRSVATIDRVLIKECAFYLRVEAQANSHKSDGLLRYAGRVEGFL